MAHAAMVLFIGMLDIWALLTRRVNALGFGWKGLQFESS